MLNFDKLLERCGDFGRFQWTMLLINYSYWMIIGYVFTITIFEAGTPKFTCSSSTTDDTSSKCIPQNTSITESNCYESNHFYSGNESSVDTNEKSNCQFGYQYDCSVWKNTITTEWSLVCDRRTVHSMVTMIFFAGFLISGLVGGRFADRYGRRKLAIIGSIGAIGSHTLCYFSPSLAWYCVARFCIPFSLYMVAISTQIYNVESVGKRHRTWVGTYSNCLFGVGIILLAAVSYLLRSWRDLELFVVFFLVPFPVLFCLLPESPRWLFAVGKDDDAKTAINLIARFNRNPQVGEEEWCTFELSDKKDEKFKAPAIMELLKLPTLRMIQLNMMFQWAATSLVYYGLTFNAGALYGDIFINTVLIGIMDAGGCAISHPIIQKVGCKKTLFFFMMVATVTCFMSILTISSSTIAVKVGVSASMIGKFSISAVFATVYLYVAEIFPTDVRTTALGLSSAAARVSSMMTSFVLQVQENQPWFAQVLFGSLALVASCLSLFLPETHNMPMLTTTVEAEEKYRSRKKIESAKKEDVKQEITPFI